MFHFAVCSLAEREQQRVPRRGDLSGVSLTSVGESTVALRAQMH